MDAVINAARSLGKIIQADERYVRYMAAQEANEKDQALQLMIENFHGIRLELSQESGKAEKDQERISRLDTQLKKLYADIFANENMLEITEARQDMEGLLGFVNQIITGSGSGMDPETIEYSSSCGGSCASCAGCN